MDTCPLGYTSTKNTNRIRDCFRIRFLPARNDWFRITQIDDRKNRQIDSNGYSVLATYNKDTLGFTCTDPNSTICIQSILQACFDKCRFYNINNPEILSEEETISCMGSDATIDKLINNEFACILYQSKPEMIPHIGIKNSDDPNQYALSRREIGVHETSPARSFTLHGSKNTFPTLQVTSKLIL